MSIIMPIKWRNKVICAPKEMAQLQLNDQLPVELRVYLDILVAVWVHNHPGLPERVIEGIVRMTMDPQVWTMVDDLV